MPVAMLPVPLFAPLPVAPDRLGENPQAPTISVIDASPSRTMFARCMENLSSGGDARESGCALNQVTMHLKTI
jgi:hypothetical protein